MATFVVALRDHPDRAAWDRALADELTARRPDWVVCAGFMKLLGAAVLGAFPGRVVNTHPALLPAFPGAHAVRDALAAGVTGTGATVHLVDSGVDTGPVLAQRPVAVLPGDDEDSPARADQDRGARAPGADPGRPGRPPGRRLSHRRRGGHPMSDRIPVRRALLGVYDKTGVEELARGLAAAGVELVITGATAARRRRRASR